MNNTEVLSTWAKNQKLGAKLPCPRCGKWKMAEGYGSNALSRRHSIEICSECGTAESLADYAHTVDTTDKWFAVKVFGDAPEAIEKDAGENFLLNAEQKILVKPSDIDDIMCGALEGGITYWCGKAEVLEDEYYGDYASEQISRGGSLRLYDAENGEEYILTLEGFLHGFKLALAAGFGSDWIKDKEVDTFNIDGPASDVIVQFAIFGEVLYG